MSAFIVSTDHINALVGWALRQRANYRDPVTRQYQTVTDYTATETGRMLLSENAKSVAHRYREGTSNEAEAYRFRPYGKPLTALQAIKLAQCLAYQSCEHDGWDDSAAKSLLDAIIANSIHDLPGYNDAAWAI